MFAFTPTNEVFVSLRQQQQIHPSTEDENENSGEPHLSTEIQNNYCVASLREEKKCTSSSKKKKSYKPRSVRVSGQSLPLPAIPLSKQHLLGTWLSQQDPSRYTTQSYSCQGSAGDGLRAWRSAQYVSGAGTGSMMCQSCGSNFGECWTSTVEDVSSYKEVDVATNISNVFFKQSLSLSDFSYFPVPPRPDRLDFNDLWPMDEHLDQLLMDTCQISSRLLLGLVRFVTLCGPLRALRRLIELNVIDAKHVFDNGISLTELACLAQNTDCVLYLTSVTGTGLSHDNSAQDEGRLTKLLACLPSLPSPPRTTVAAVLSGGVANPSVISCPPHTLIPASSAVSPSKKPFPTLHEKQQIFELARNTANMELLLTKLQAVNFDVNKETDMGGDFLVHTVVRQGLSQLPVLLLLVRLFDAEVNLPNSDGLTCLMLAACLNNAVLADVLLCLLGAKPDCRCALNGWTALHFACCEGHMDVVNVLLKRGADFNIEDSTGARPDDIARQHSALDCCDVITSWRCRSIDTIKRLIEKDELKDVSQLRGRIYTVDDSGYTLIMLAVNSHSMVSLEFLLRQQNTPIDAQHGKTLRTALSLAAIDGATEATRLLLSYGANASIHDIDGLLALHHAVIGSHFDVINCLLRHTAALTGLHKAIDLAADDVIRASMKSAMMRRQSELVRTTIFQFAEAGDSDALYTLLEDGDDVNCSNDFGDWPIYLAAQHGHVSTARLLLQWGADVTRHHPVNGNTALHISCAESDHPIVQLLLQQHSICNHGDGTERVGSNGNTRCRGIKRDSRTTPEACSEHASTLGINVLNYMGMTPLMLAANKGDLSLVTLLLRYGASPNVLSSSGELYHCQQYAGINSALHTHLNDHTSQIFSCIENKNGLKTLKTIFLPKHDHNLQNESGDTPLMRACFLGRLNIVEFLLESVTYSLYDAKIFPISARTSVRTSAYERTLRNDTSKRGLNDELLADSLLGSSSLPLSYEFVENDLLTSLVASMDTVCRTNPILVGVKVYQLSAVNANDGRTAFHRTVEGGDFVEVLDRLLEADQSASSVQDTQGLSLLHLACQLNRKKIVKKLTNTPYIDLNCRTLDGRLIEDMTSLKSLKSLISQARGQPDDVIRRRVNLLSWGGTPSGSSKDGQGRTGRGRSEEYENGDEDVDKSVVSMTTASIIDFERLQRRFESLRDANTISNWAAYY